MINDRILRKALQSPPLSGKVALLFCIAAIAVPTLIRAALHGLVTAGVFLITSALIIVIVQTVRSFIEDCLAPHASDEIRIIFSEKKGEAWAHWYAERPPVKLGPHKEVAEMMEDYVAQVRLGERLTGKSDLPDA